MTGTLITFLYKKIYYKKIPLISYFIHTSVQNVIPINRNMSFNRTGGPLCKRDNLCPSDYCNYLQAKGEWRRRWASGNWCFGVLSLCSTYSHEEDKRFKQVFNYKDSLSSILSFIKAKMFIFCFLIINKYL